VQKASTVREKRGREEYADRREENRHVEKRTLVSGQQLRIETERDLRLFKDCVAQ